MSRLYVTREDFNTEAEYLADRKHAMDYALKAAESWYKERPTLLNEMVLDMARHHAERAGKAITTYQTQHCEVSV